MRSSGDLTRAMLALTSAPSSGSTVSRDDHESPNRSKVGNGSGAKRLVAVERCHFADHRAAANRRDRDHALEDLREVVIDRVFLERTNHRIVAAERRKPAADEERPGRAEVRCPARRRAARGRTCAGVVDRRNPRRTRRCSTRRDRASGPRDSAFRRREASAMRRAPSRSAGRRSPR